jgi:hypothetical protein
VLIYWLFLFILTFAVGTAHAQEDSTDIALQKAQTALKDAQAAYDAALKAKQSSDAAKAKSNSATTPTQMFYPIDTELGVYDDGMLGIAYSYQGHPLKGFKDYADVIRPLNDPKCDSLLNASSTEDILGWVSVVAGFGLDTYYLVDVLNKAYSGFSNPDSFGPNIEADTPFIIAGSVLVAGGSLLFVASHGDFNHAINRYNKLVARQGQVAFYFSPDLQKPEVGLVEQF